MTKKRGGLICLKCGGKTKVVNSRPNVYGTNRTRWHVCQKCGREFQTYATQPMPSVKEE